VTAELFCNVYTIVYERVYINHPPLKIGSKKMTSPVLLFDTLCYGCHAKQHCHQHYFLNFLFIYIFARFGGLMPLFLIYYFLSNATYSFITYHNHRGTLRNHHRFRSEEGPPRGAGAGIEPRPAVQQADSLLSEIRRNLLSYAAPYRAIPHPIQATLHCLSCAASLFL
jgi:hypothetical protein